MGIRHPRKKGRNRFQPVFKKKGKKMINRDCMLITILILEVIHITFWGTILVLCEIVIL